MSDRKRMAKTFTHSIVYICIAFIDSDEDVPEEEFGEYEPSSSESEKTLKRKPSDEDTLIEEGLIEAFEQYEIQEHSPSSTSFYVESESRSGGTCKSIRSIYPPKSYDSADSGSNYPYPEYGSIMRRSKSSVDFALREFSRVELDLLPVVSSSQISVLQSSTNLKKQPLKKKSKQYVPKRKVCPRKKTKKKIIPVEKESNGILVKPMIPLSEIMCLPIPELYQKKLFFVETLLVGYDFSNTCKEQMSLLQSEVDRYPKIMELLPLFYQEVGAFCVRIESTGNDNLLTFSTSQLSLNGSGGSTSVLSVVGPDLSLVEEIRTETKCFENGKIEKSMHLFRENDGYIALKTINDGKNVKEQRSEVKLTIPGDLVEDGGLFILMRYLIVTNFDGTFQTWTLDIDGKMCRCEYEVGKKRVININGKPVKTIRIKRKLYRRKSLEPEVAKTYFLSSGHMIRHQWNNCPYFLHLRPSCLNDRTPMLHESLESNWMSDFILKSKFNEEKRNNQEKIETYLFDHPEIKNIMQDYLLCLLNLKPPNIIQFTIDHFLNLFKE